MNSIWLIILLLCCCNGDGCNNTVSGRNCGCGNVTNDGGCGCGNHANDGDCGCTNNVNSNRCNCHADHDDDCGCPSPFPGLNRRERDYDSEYSVFRGNNGPCGCEENNL